MRAVGARKAAGVTLMELMLVVAIVGLLAIIGVPTYRQYMMRTHRTEAKSALLRIAADQERFYLQNNRYATTFVELNTFPGGVSENSVYTLTLTVPTPLLAFTASAAPRAGGGTNGVDQTPDAECGTFTINSQGIRTAAPNPNGRCW
jgi:type IV pilus assembly protein PilE